METIETICGRCGDARYDRAGYKAPLHAGGVPGAAAWEVIFDLSGYGSRPVGRRQGCWPTGATGSLQAGRVRIVGVNMQTVVAFLKDKAGASSTKLALMI